ncbi:DegT/DnrJ/EryC1/StrS family aminotransferase [Ovoidimarina sediminis]|uniref:DegT/DnrJ/EryC1/StrS family aminotransferase n=1 Tax=Ovoidimarina sediminis TaxID=3079856 RepID=UPI00290E316E|nr:DegT/DnrJ/EryC1/StrS family aminotransferase [Rhodophyticola sp. MJ-SS7]MDU8944072.1 DegT/DnrJ/EryC1/StrS family aminotransferase [Rhodophyticola sp. MJ-SS7]
MEKLRFVEAKTPDMDRIAALFEQCAEVNFWANRGPLYQHLTEAYTDHVGLAPEAAFVPCANGGIALEVLARIHAMRAGGRLRWAASAFSFANIGRGYFADVVLVDCDENGMLDVRELKARADEFDGIVVTNVFGCWADFSPWVEVAKATGKALIIDNAAGMSTRIPDWPWQSFSLHHTKPYGAGEGGLMVVPAEDADLAYGMIDYGAADGAMRTEWLNNGKISDISCAFLIDRLEQRDQWAPNYVAAAEMVDEIARGAGYVPLIGRDLDRPAMSRAYIAPTSVGIEAVRASTHVSFGKYYQPLALLQRTERLYDRLVNIPTHPDMLALERGHLEADLGRLTG